MYSILECVYGVDFTDEVADGDETVNYLAEIDIFDRAYCGSGNTPYWIGKNYGSFAVFEISHPGQLLDTYPNDSQLAKDWKEKKQEVVDDLDKVIKELRSGRWDEITNKDIADIIEFQDKLKNDEFEPQKIVLYSTS